MPSLMTFVGFAVLCLGMVLTPGPNMIYVISRSITQGRVAGFMSVAGFAIAFLIYMLSAAFGITALIFAVPYAYDALRFAGAAYLLWLAWQALRPNGRSTFELKKLTIDSRKKLFTMGFVTSLVNPKVALLYLSLLPQFIDPALGHIFMQSVLLGLTQITVSITVNCLIACAAGSIAHFLAASPKWALFQRWLMGTVLAGLAFKMMLEARK